MTTRRTLLRAAALTGAAPGPVFAGSREADPWAEVPSILARIRPPRIPARRVRLTDFVTAGAKDHTSAFARAIEACHAAGGGRVMVPAGDWPTGPIRLRSRVELHLEKGSALRFSRDPKAYLPLIPTRWEGIELMNYQPMIWARDETDIAITGEGLIDGQADNATWWPWKGKAEFGLKPGQPHQAEARARLFAMAEAGVPVAERVFGEGSYLRPQFIQPYRCRKVLIEGVTLRGSPMWQVHPVLCVNVIVRGLNIGAPGPNTDGCDPESCRDVLIEHCVFDTGDDCIAIKSGRNADGRRLATPSENIIIRHCRMLGGHGAATIGSEISGGVRKVFVEQCLWNSPHLDFGVRIKNNALRGGVLEDLHFRRIAIGEVGKAAIAIDFNYEEGAKGPFKPVLRRVSVEKLYAAHARRAVDLQGLDGAPAQGMLIRDCDFEDVKEPPIVRHIEGLRVERVRVNGRPDNLAGA